MHADASQCLCMRVCCLCAFERTYAIYVYSFDISVVIDRPFAVLNYCN